MKNMANTVEINTKKNIVEFTQSCYANGYNAIIPIINGKEYNELLIGYTSEEDKESAIKLLREAIESTNNISEVKRYLLSAFKNIANNVHPDEQIDIDGYTFMFSYIDKKAYLLDGTEIVNANDVSSEDDEIIKIVLTERVKNYMYIHHM